MLQKNTPLPFNQLSFVLLGIVCLLTFFLYSQAKDGPLILDDRPNIVVNQKIRITELTSESLYAAATSMRYANNDKEPLLNRPLSYLSFALDHYFSDNYYPSIKTTNILLHLICALLLYKLLCQILPLLTATEKTGDMQLLKWLPLIVSCFWLLHPLMVSTVLYSIQRMTILSTLFSLVALNCFFYFRNVPIGAVRSLLYGLLSVSFFCGLAFLSKENGILVLLLCGLIELSLYRGKFNLSISNTLKYSYFALLLLPALFVFGYLIKTYLQSSDAVLSSRLFNTEMRLMTEARVLFSYLYWLVYPVADQLTFHHDNYLISRSLLNPVSTIVAIIGWFSIIVGTSILCYKKKAAWLVFAVGWYLIGHVLESSVINLELVFEHRNYLPYIGPMFALLWASILALSYLRISDGLKLFSISLIFVAIPGLITMDRLTVWKSEQALIGQWLKVNPQSPRTWSALSEHYFQNNQPQMAINALIKGFELAPWEAGFGMAQLAIMCKSSMTLSGESPDQLIRQTVLAVNQKPNTAYTFTQLNTLTVLCKQIAEIKKLMPIYQAITQQNNPKAAALGFYMLALIELDNGNKAQAKLLLQQVLDRDPTSVQVRQLYQKL